MTPDKRYYIQLVSAKDKGTETIYVGTKNLKAKFEREHPGVICWLDNLPISEAFGNTSDGLAADPQVAVKLAGPSGVQARLAALTNLSELVIRGHGNVQLNRCGNISGISLAHALYNWGFRASCRINFTGCSLGRNSEVDGNAVASGSAADVGARSFAAEFQRTLFKASQAAGHPMINEIHARTSNVSVKADGSKTTRDLSAMSNEPTADLFHAMFDDTVTLPPQVTGGSAPPHVPHQKNSKIIFTINAAGVQTMTYAY